MFCVRLILLPVAMCGIPMSTVVIYLATGVTFKSALNESCKIFTDWYNVR